MAGSGRSLPQRLRRWCACKEDSPSKMSHSGTLFVRTAAPPTDAPVSRRSGRSRRRSVALPVTGNVWLGILCATHVRFDTSSHPSFAATGTGCYRTPFGRMAFCLSARNLDLGAAPQWLHTNNDICTIAQGQRCSKGERIHNTLLIHCAQKINATDASMMDTQTFKCIL